MKIVLFTDNSLALQLAPLCAVLNNVCSSTQFQVGQSKFKLSKDVVSFPSSYKVLSRPLQKEASGFDLAILCTQLPYDNNYFYDYDGDIVILSFYDWHHLTDLPVSNGLAYFIASILIEMRGGNLTHKENTGCLNDFLWDKSGVDVGMRAAFICRECLTKFKGGKPLLQDVQSILNIVSQYSRNGRNIIEMEIQSKIEPNYDVFLCHNSEDKPEIRKMNKMLKKRRIRTWFDEERLPLGTPWQTELENNIANVNAACVFVGSNGIGPWQNQEIRAFLSEFLRRGCPVIPVILPSATAIPKLPVFLSQMNWLDMRRSEADSLKKLVGELKRIR